MSRIRITTIDAAMMIGKTKRPVQQLAVALEVHVEHRHERELGRREDDQDRDEGGLHEGVERHGGPVGHLVGEHLERGQ